MDYGSVTEVERSVRYLYFVCKIMQLSTYVCYCSKLGFWPKISKELILIRRSFGHNILTVIAKIFTIIDVGQLSECSDVILKFSRNFSGSNLVHRYVMSQRDITIRDFV